MKYSHAIAFHEGSHPLANLFDNAGSVSTKHDGIFCYERRLELLYLPVRRVESGREYLDEDLAGTGFLNFLGLNDEFAAGAVEIQGFLLRARHGCSSQEFRKDGNEMLFHPRRRLLLSKLISLKTSF